MTSSSRLPRVLYARTLTARINGAIRAITDRAYNRRGVVERVERRDDHQPQQRKGEQQDFFPTASRLRFVYVAGNHLCPRSTHQAISLCGIEADSLRSGFRRSRCHGAPVQIGPVRPVTLRRHLSMTLPFSKSRSTYRIRFSAFPKLLASCQFRFGRRHHAAGRKSIGYTIVTAGTPSFGPKLIVLTRSTT